MRIEDVTKEKLAKARDEELNSLRSRFTEIWNKEIKKSLWASAVRSDFLRKYILLLNELKTRKLEKSTAPIDRAAFSKIMTMKKFRIDVTDLKDIVLVPNCIVVDADSANPKVLETTVKKQHSELLELLKQREGIGEDTYIPAYDLVLCAKEETVRVDIQKPYPNEHSARLQSPDMAHIRVRRTHGSGKGRVQGISVPSSIDVVWFVTRKDGGEVPVPQALRFPIKSWTAAKAKKWLSDNDITSKFEPATKKAKKMWSKKYVEKLPDSAFLHIEEGDEGKRHFPYKGSDGEVDVTHLEKAISGIPGSSLPESTKTELQTTAKSILEDVKEGKVFETFMSVYPVDKAGKGKDERIVCGVVYQPDVVDAQGDKASEVEIRKAAYQFMEKVQTFKVNHEGGKVRVRVLESYVAPIEFTVAKQTIKKGSWVLTVRVLDKKVWEKVKSGELTGFSMAGYARAS